MDLNKETAQAIDLSLPPPSPVVETHLDPAEYTEEAAEAGRGRARMLWLIPLPLLWLQLPAHQVS